VNEVDEGGFVREGRRNFMAASSFEYEARFGAVDTNLLYIRVRKVLSQRAKRGHRRKNPAQQLFGLAAVHRRHRSSLHLAHYTSDELSNPELIFQSHAREITPCQLGRKLGLDARSDLQLDASAICGVYCHPETAVPRSGWRNLARAWRRRLRLQTR
jgi:hypothetical protein